MIFSELYSAYYNAVSRIIRASLNGERSERAFRAIVEEYAFGESVLTVLPALKSGKWQLLCSDGASVIKNPPELPLTALEKSWLKAISLDPRIKLFGISLPDFDGVEPFFTPEDYRLYDQYSDGDPFADEGYIRRFQFVLSAIEERRALTFEMLNRNNSRVRISGIPIRLEYSEKDDKFRVILSGTRRAGTVNLGRVLSVWEYRGSHSLQTESKPDKECELVLTVDDYRNALERVMLHFAHFEKRAERVDGNRYRLRIKYEHSDEAEMLIRVLSFGPMVRVEAPTEFVERIRERLKLQKEIDMNL